MIGNLGQLPMDAGMDKPRLFATLWATLGFPLGGAATPS